MMRHIPDTGTVELARGRYFTAHRLQGVPDAALAAEYAGPLLVIPRTGDVRLNGEVLRAGDCASAPGIDALSFAPEGQAIIVRPPA